MKRMMDMGRIKKEAGLTLVEVLAALVLLSIVFIGFMTIFPQMTSFNAKTGEKLETMNLAKIELINIKQSPPRPEKFEVQKEGDYERYHEMKDDYEIEIDCFKAEPNRADPDKTEEKYCSESNGSGLLHKTHIKVTKQDQLISETFGYVKFSRFSN